MKSCVLIPFLIALTGCVSIPAAPSSDAEIRITGADIPSGELLFCTLPALKAQCRPKSAGLVARGFGGLFLPLVVELTSLKLINGRAKVALKVNNITAYCSTGESNIKTHPPTINVTGIYCNWLVIGNVVASLHLHIDTFVDENSYTGRYRILFFGTGNGGGAGYFFARKPI